LRLARGTAIAIVLIALGALVFQILGDEEGSEPDGPATGRALEVGSFFEVEIPIGPGQEVVEMYSSVLNRSASVIELEEIKPVGAESGPVELLGLHVVSGPHDGGLFNTIPPVTRRGGRCLPAAMMQVRGYQLEPGAEVMIATHVRASEAGPFRWEGRDITYSQLGRTYVQRDPFFFVGEVRAGWERELRGAERRCKGVTLLPGA
jgi:hypothetical protein